MKGKLKTNKGITLIALIITIIVLLILAMVSVKLIVDNGIVGRSKSATSKYTVEQEKELIKLAYSDYKMGIAESEPFSEDKNLLERYFLGENKEGRKLDSFFDRNEYKFIGNDVIKDAKESITYVRAIDIYLSKELFIVFLYNNNEYQVAISNYDSSYLGNLSKRVELMNIPSNFSIDGADILEDGQNGWKITFNKTGNLYKLNTEGKIEELLSGKEELELLERYFLGEDKQGNKFEDVVYIPAGSMGNPDMSVLEFKDNNIIKDASTKLKLKELYGDSSELYIIFEYENKLYRLQVNYIDKINKSVELVYLPQGREGQKVLYSYDGTKEHTEAWTILYDYGDSVEIISPRTMGGLRLGNNDEEAQNPGDIDKDGTANTDIDKAIYSYNNVVNRINEYCASLITNPNKISVRSVGSNPNNPEDKSSETYTSSNLEKWHNGKYNGIAKKADDNYTYDVFRMMLLEERDNWNVFDQYWLASRSIEEWDNTEYVRFLARYTTGGGFDLWEGLWTVSQTNIESFDWAYANVRPVVKISSDSIK